MKGKLILVSLFLFGLCVDSYAQYAEMEDVMSRQSWVNGFDAWMCSLRMNDFSGYCVKADDYIQYSPAAVMVIAKACGLKGRSDWGRMFAADAFSLAFMAGIVNATKYSARRMRPDGSRRNSFPSGHTATAFCLAHMLHKEYGWRYPLVSLTGYTLASFTGLSRILNNRHWGTDVLAGALIGIASTELGYLANDAIFRHRHRGRHYVPEEFEYDCDALRCDVEHLYGYSAGLGKNAVSGAYVGVQASVRAFPKFRLRARLGISSAASHYNLYSVLGGLCYAFPLTRRFEGEVSGLLGYAYRGKVSESCLSYPGVKNLGFNAGFAFNLILSNHFKLKALVESESFLSCSSDNYFRTGILAGLGGSFYF